MRRIVEFRLKSHYEVALDVVSKGIQSIEIPVGARFLVVYNQYEQIVISFEVDVSVKDYEVRKFAVIVQQCEYPEGRTFLGRVAIEEESYGRMQNFIFEVK